MKRVRLNVRISYRLTEEDLRQIQLEVEDEGGSVNDWCRDAVLEKLRKLREAGEKSTPAETGNGTERGVNDWVLSEQITRIEYLIEHGFGIALSADKTTYREWVRRVKDSK